MPELISSPADVHHEPLSGAATTAAQLIGSQNYSASLQCYRNIRAQNDQSEERARKSHSIWNQY
ncbi:MAG: hypothetical protein V4472_24420 [Pseudomonadota bacterium]